MAPSPPAPASQSPLAQRQFVVLLLAAAFVGLVVSFAAWGFLELVHQIQVGVFTDLPKDLGYDHGAPLWWPLPVCTIGATLVAAAVVLLPGRGGHIPAYGLNPGPVQPRELAGIVVAALATLGSGLVLGPEAPLIALGGGLGLLAVRLARRDAPPQLAMVMAAAGSFAAISMIFDSPIIAAVILIEATGLGGERLPLVLLPGLLAAGIGSLIAIGMGSWTGLSTSAFSLGALQLPAFARPQFTDFAWSIALGIAVAIVAFAILRLARRGVPLTAARPWAVLPIGGLAVAGAAIAFQHTSGRSFSEVLFSGQDQLPSLVSQGGTWSVSALLLLLLFKGLAWSVSLASFRGGPTFPAMFLGAAGGLLAAHLPGYASSPAVAVGLAAGVAAVLELPLSAVVIGVLLTEKTAPGASPLVIVGVVVAYLTIRVLGQRLGDGRPATPATPAQAPDPARAGAGGGGEPHPVPA